MILWLLLALILGLAAPAQAERGIFRASPCTDIPSPVAGDTYCFDQANNILKAWDGVRWVTMPVAAPLYVDDFGARGDGATDNAAAIQAAIDAAGANQRIVFSLTSGGTYGIASGLNIPSGKQLIWDGAGASLITLAAFPALSDMLTVQSSYTTITNMNFNAVSRGRDIIRVTGEDLKFISINGNTFDRASTTGKAIRGTGGTVNGWWKSSIDGNDFVAPSAAGDAIYIDTGGGYFMIRNNLIRGGPWGYGIFWNGLAGAFGPNMSGNSVAGAASGVTVQSTDKLRFEHNLISQGVASTHPEAAMLFVTRPTGGVTHAAPDIVGNLFNGNNNVTNAIKTDFVTGGRLEANSFAGVTNYLRTTANTTTVWAFSNYAPGLLLDDVGSAVRFGVGVVDVSHFGAKGDNAADDTTAIRNAITAARSGDTLFFPLGIYKVSDPTAALTITKLLHIRGTPGALIRGVGAGHTLVIDGTGIANGMNGGSIDSLQVSSEATGADAVRLIHWSRGVVKGLLVPSAGAAGLRLLGSLVNDINVVVSVNLPYTAGTRKVMTHGIVFDVQAAVSANANVCRACALEGITTAPGFGVLQQGLSYGNVFAGGTSEGNTVGLQIETHQIVAINFDLESNTTNVAGASGKVIFLGADADSPVSSVLGLLGASALQLYSSYVSSTNYSALKAYYNSVQDFFEISTIIGAAGAHKNMVVGPGGGGAILCLRANGTNIACVDSTKLYMSSDNATDIGASGANRPRTGYFSSSLVVGVSPTGGDPGPGRTNVATGYFLNGTQGWRATGTPSCSANCGTSPSVTGTDSIMTVTLGTAPPAASTFTVSFSSAYTAAPVCIATRGTTGTSPTVTGVVTTTTTAVVNLSANMVASELYHVMCGGRS